MGAQDALAALLSGRYRFFCDPWRVWRGNTLSRRVFETLIHCGRSGLVYVPHSIVTGDLLENANFAMNIGKQLYLLLFHLVFWSIYEWFPLNTYSFRDQRYWNEL